jgi:hypothetical protein
MPSWSLRELVEFLHRLFGHLDAAVGSVAGLLTVFSWWRGGTSPLETLGRFVLWFGIDIRKNLSHAGLWLNTPHRHHTVVVASVIVLVTALLARMLTASVWSFARERRFWAVVWCTTCVLAQLGQTSWGTVVLAAVAISLVNMVVVAELSGPGPPPLVGILMAPAATLAGALMGLGAVVFGLLSFVGGPSQSRKSES